MGYGPPPDPYTPPGFGGPPPPESSGVGRLLKTALIGGAIGGVLSAIPILKFLNCCFCLLNMGGAAVGVSMYLKEHPTEKITNGDALASGAISGGLAGLIAAICELVVNLLVGTALSGTYRKALPHDVSRLMVKLAGQGVIGVVTAPLFYAVFGSLAGFLALQLFFKDRIAKG
jgi:hypothetical protein